MGATIRPAKTEDARAIAEVHVASWRWGYHDQLPEELLAQLSVDEREAQWVSQLATDDADVVVAEDAGSVVGFASATASRDEGVPASTGEVLTVYVTEVAAGTGVASALLSAAEDALRSRGFASATLWVLESNPRARRFYERSGWAWDGATSDHQIQCDHRPIVRYAKAL